jgi:nitrogen fixation protein FixH
MKALIALVTLIALSAVIAAIVIGSRSFEGIVTEKPYEKGLSWDRTKDEKKSLGWDVEIPEKRFTVGKNTLIFSILDKKGRPLEGASISVTVSRPSTTAYDRTFKGERLDNGSYRAVVDFPLYGYWDLKIQVVKDQVNVIYTKNIFAEK